MNMLKLNLIACTLFAAVAVVAVPEGPRSGTPAQKGTSASAAKPAPKVSQTSAKPAQKAPQASAKPTTAKKGNGLHRSTRKTDAGQAHGRRHDFDDERLPPEERHLMRMLEHGRDFEELVRVFPRASRSHNPDIRSALVDALEEHEGRALPMLAAMIADPDEEVSESAFSAWMTIVNDMRYMRRPRALIEAAAAIQSRIEPPPTAVPAVVQPVTVTQPVVTQPVVATPAVTTTPVVTQPVQQ